MPIKNRKNFNEEEYNRIVTDSKNEKDVDYILMDYPGIIIRTYKPSVANYLYSRLGIRMKKFHNRLNEKELEKTAPKKIRKMKSFEGFYFSNDLE